MGLIHPSARTVDLGCPMVNARLPRGRCVEVVIGMAWTASILLRRGLFAWFHEALITER